MTRRKNDGQDDAQTTSATAGAGLENGRLKGRRNIIKGALAAAPLIVTVPARRAGASGSHPYVSG